MLAYDAFIQQTTHFQPRLILKIGGVEVTDRLIEDHSVVTDALLDTPTLNVYTTARATFCLDNSDNLFNTKATSNFFTELTPSRPVHGWQTPAEISVVFEGDPNAPSTPKIFFVGYVEDVTEFKDQNWVSVLLLDQSGLLQRAIVENFGSPVSTTIGGVADNPNYSSVNPFFNLPVNSAPVSRNSLSATLLGVTLTVLPTLPRSGRVLTAEHVAVNENSGTLHFGSEPEQEVHARVNVEFKTAYRYRTPEALVSELLEESDVYSEHTTDEKNFAKTFVESPSLEHSVPQFSSHGRPQVGTVAPVMRWIRSDLSGFYMGGSRTLFRYRRRDDANGVLDQWDALSNCPDIDAAILQFEKVGDDFYVLTVNTWQGRAAKLWKVSNGLSNNPVWTEISGANATATHFFDYFTQSDPAADNRKTFVVHQGYLYYVFNSGTAYGVRRVQLSTDTVSTVFTQAITDQIPESTPYGLNFTVVSSVVYVFVCQRPRNASAHLRVFSMGLDGSGQTEIFVESWEDEREVRKAGHPAMVTDVVHRGGDFYFVLTFQSSLVGSARAELSKLDTSASTRYILKTYENSRFAARSLVVHREDSEDNIYFVEGTYISGIFETDQGIRVDYPTHEDSGHFGRIDVHDMVVDYGPIWESFRDPAGTGVGLHTAFCSNLHRNASDGTLHLISGYGLLSDSAQDTQQSQTDTVTASVDNWVWLQYGKKLATKIPIFPTNDRTVWSLLEELARVVDFELGFTSGQDEIADFLQLYPHLTLEPRGYLFFRERGSQEADFVIDESSLVGVSSRLDTTLIFNHVSMPYGSGAPWIERTGESRIRSLPLPNTVLTDNDGAWAELITLRYLERQKRPRLKTRMPMKVAPQLALGQRLRVTHERHSLDDTPFRVTEIQHNFNLFQTELEMREDLEYVPFVLPQPEDLEYTAGDSVSVVLPEAMGGEDPLTYALFGAPVWLSFDASARRLTGTAVVGDFELRYRVTDSSSPAEFKIKRFRIKVLPVVTTGALAFVSAVQDPSIARIGCQVPRIQLPSGSGGVSPLLYSLSALPDGYEYDDDDLAIDGIPTVAGTTSMMYTVKDSMRPTAAEVTETFDLVVESKPSWVGIGFLGQTLYGLDTVDLKCRAFPTSGRDPDVDITFAAGTFVDMDSDGSNLLILNSATPEMLVYDSMRMPQGVISLPAGDWVACAMTATRRYALNKEDWTVRSYSTTGTEFIAERLELGYEGNYVSIVVSSGILYALLSDSPVVLAWNMLSGELSESNFSELVDGSSDWSGVTLSGSLLYGVRENSERAVAVTLSSGVRVPDSDRSLL